MPPIVNDRVAWSVCLCQSVSLVENWEAIEIPFAFRTLVDPGNHLLHIADRFEAIVNIVLFHLTQYSHLVRHQYTVTMIRRTCTTICYVMSIMFED